MAYIDEPTNGKVREVKGSEVLVEREDGFEEWADSSQLIKRGKLEVKEVVQKDQSIPRKATPLRRDKVNYLEVDLHIHELVETKGGMSNFQILRLQMDEAQKTIEKARRGFIKKVILIHGVGEGRLRSELHEMLRGMEKINFYDADFTKYGAGATEVDLY